VPGVYLFEWQDGSTDPFFIVSDSGIYYVIVTDYQGCRAADSITIYTSPRPITPTSVILPFDTSINSDTLCAGESIAMQMAPLENASYAWQGPNNTIFNGQDLTLNNLTLAQSGQYKAYYTVDGCESFFDTLFVQVNPTPEVYIGLSDTLCDVNDIILDAGFGDAYTYLWQDNSTNQTFTVNQDGAYSVVVTNGFECSKSASVTLAFSISPNAPLLSTNGQDVLSDIFCEGEQLSLSVPPVSGNAYYWVLNGDTVSSVGNQYLLTDLVSNQTGMYYAYYYANGCASLSDSSDISILESPQFEFTTKDTSICGNTPYLLSAASVTEVSYLWQDASTQASYLVSSSGEYWVTLTNDIGCSSSDTVNVLYKPYPISPIISGDVSVCDGSNLDLNSNNENGVIYNWNGPGFSNTGASISITNASTSNEGSYTLSASLDGCISPDIATVNVIIQSLPLVELGENQNICAGNFISINGPDGMTTYSWSNGSNTQSALLPDGSYTLTITDANGCENQDAITITEGGPTASFISDPTTGSQTGNTVTFTDVSQGSPISWNWNFGDNSGSSNQNTTHVFENQGVLTISLIVTDAAGCSDTTSREFTVSNSVEVPNSFTPNGDGKNEFFFIKGLEAFPNSKLTVLNRWGNEVYSSNDYTNSWNAEKLPDGVYFYILDLANNEFIKGDVTILRN
jgi:gliding motility-associated-like protein